MHESAPIADVFERHRRHLIGLAYRMLGSVAAAEDAVQEAYLRWHRADRAAVADPRRFLGKIVTRLCLDEMKSARARRETYIGPWLPEPVVEAAGFSTESASEYADDLSVGLMLALERLSPLERAAFLLHEIFDVDYAEVATLLERSEAACRQLVARARANIRESRARCAIPADGGRAIAEAFATAVRVGDVGALAGLLAADATLHTDGGGKRKAALQVIMGRDRIVRFSIGVSRKFTQPATISMRFATINGMAGFVSVFEDGGLQTTAFEIVDGRITAIYVVRNPDKLAHLGRADAT
ncbi:MAG: polymerase sigma factor SigJ [Rhodospirillales bacterium]|nr:polymerase sigma factor SigJ [Rhodospirillales bacterium]